MNFAVGVIIKTTILLACASLMTLGLRRASASARHTLWSVALLAALFLPVASRLVPQLPLPVLPEESLGTASPLVNVGKPNTSEATPKSLPHSLQPPAPGPASPSPQAPAVDTWTVFSLWTGRGLLLLWSMGAAVVVLRLLMGSLTIRRLRRHSTAVEETGWQDILDDLKATFDLRRPIRLRISQ